MGRQYYPHKKRVVTFLRDFYTVLYIITQASTLFCRFYHKPSDQTCNLPKMCELFLWSKCTCTSSHIQCGSCILCLNASYTLVVTASPLLHAVTSNRYCVWGHKHLSSIHCHAHFMYSVLTSYSEALLCCDYYYSCRYFSC